MRKYLFLILILNICGISLFAQHKHSEYWYLGFKMSAIHNISLAPPNNDSWLINSPNGDLLKQNNSFITYTPGGSSTIIFNFDSKNDIMGFVVGIDIQNYGFHNSYKAQVGDFKIINEYRVTSVGIPIYFKYWSSSIYKNQMYLTIGIEYNRFINVYNYQTSNWNSLQYITKLPKEQTVSSSISATLGFNYKLFFINLNLLAKNFVNKKYQTHIEEGNVSPYQHINILNGLTIQTGLNIPLTRWLTVHNWTAEKIRRMFKSSR